jgi:hypothetical protein
MPGFLFCICSLLVVIPGRAKREPGIHNHKCQFVEDRGNSPGYGCSMLRITPEDA